MKYNRDDLFYHEVNILETAKREMASSKYQDNPMLPEYRELVDSYQQLLRTTKKIFKISDTQGYALKERESKMKRLLDNSAQGFLTFGNNLLVDQEYSAECDIIFGEKIANKDITSLLSNSYEEQLRYAETFKKAFLEQSQEKLEKLSDIININERQIDISYKLTGKLGNEYSIFVILTDVTEKIKSEAEVKFLSEYNRLKDEFLANTSHELRTPVNSMIAITESVLDGAEGPIDIRQKEALSIVVESGRRLSNLINDILDYARIKNGTLSLQKGYFSAEKLVESLVKEFEFSAANKNITIKSEMQEDLPRLYADKYRIIQVLYNLMDNAVKFTSSGGTICLRIYKEPKHICMAVKDTGIGIPEERLEDIFASFEQVDTSLTRKQGGMGLGLSISKKIAKAHGGDIKVRSTAHQGSEFVFCIPLQKDNEVKLNQEQPLQINEITVQSPNNLEVKGKTNDMIVVIDDNYSNIAGVAGILKTEGYSIKGFVDPYEGLEEVLRNRNTVLAVVDLMMPGISGYEICEKIRERYTLYELPVLILTARTQLDSIIRSFKAGANDILYKPFNGEELKARAATLNKLKGATETAINNEIAMLQAQINPHFLFNAMNAVAACCYDDSEKAAEAVITLSDYFAHSFDFEVNAKEVPLKREVELIRAYLSVEKLRFDERLEFEIDIDDSLPVLIPPFIIQPIVENAVRHGITQKEEGGSIRISGRNDGENYRILVEDTGVGISNGKLEDILSGCKKADGRGIGLMNVRRRLKRLYGTDVHIESVCDVGTKVTVLIKTQVGSSHADGNTV